MLFDAHFHIVQSFKADESQDWKEISGCSCAHDSEEFLEMERIIRENCSEKYLKKAFGLHPQLPSMKDMGFLDSLLKEKRIAAIGETGFDFFTEEYRNNREMQEKAFIFCVEEAGFYNVPLVIHNRKALDLMFKYKNQLKKADAVIFHSFAFGYKEAISLLNNGINCYFSFGKPLINGSKKAAECVEKLDETLILLETDAPFQTLKGESFTYCSDIKKVYEKACEIRKVDFERLENAVERNFRTVFGLQ